MSLDELIAAAGGVSKLADAAQVDHSTISAGWRRRDCVPVKRAILINAALGIPLHEIRPDIWAMPAEAAQ